MVIASTLSLGHLLLFALLTFALGLIALLLGGPFSAGAQAASPAPTPSAAHGDFAGLVDIGQGRRLWLDRRAPDPAV
jgi:hypothetical protein